MSSNAITAEGGKPALDLSTAALIISGISFAAIAAAWAFEYAGYAPCELCLEERIPFYVAIPGGLLAAFVAGRWPRLAAILVGALALGFFYNAGLSAYHAGAEWHFWPGPDTCTEDTLKSVGSLSKSLQNNKLVRCDEAAIRIFGISLAGYNVLLSAALAFFGAFAALNRRWRSGQGSPLIAAANLRRHGSQ